MNFTLSLLAGLFLLLPGITALVSWNFQNVNHDAKRPDLQLTSLTALFAALGIAVLMHLLGWGLTNLAWASALELGRHWAIAPIIEQPYDTAVEVAMGKAAPTTGALGAFVIVTLFECLLSWRLVASKGLDIAMEAIDVRSQGWVFQHVVRPQRHGYKPIGYVLTNSSSAEYGIGYQGTIADIRQDENGALKSIGLADPERFVYQIVQRKPDQPDLIPHIETFDRDWVGGIVVLDASVVRNIVIKNIPRRVIEEIQNVPVGDNEEANEADDLPIGIDE